MMLVLRVKFGEKVYNVVQGVDISDVDSASLLLFSSIMVLYINVLDLFVKGVILREGNSNLVVFLDGGSL